jgi:hypothetical protein
MRYLLLLALGQLSAVEFLGVNYDQDDKRSHFVLGVATSGLALATWDLVRPEAAWYEKLAVGIGSAAIVGAAKEWADGNDPLHHTQDRYDFIATTTGGAAFTLCFCWTF